MNMLTHLIEFRKRLIRCSLVILCIFIGLFYIDDYLYTVFAKPLLTQLPLGSALIATEVTTTFTVPMKLALIAALFISIPYVLYELWSFIAPGLFLQEKQKIIPFILSSTILFYLGVSFAYFVICPLALGFFANCAPKGVLVMTDIKSYLDFVLTLLFSSGLAFQVPVITLVLIKTKVVTIEKLSHLRPYVIVTAFILGMILTPPDVVSQILLALPMWGLFEIGLILGKVKTADASYGQYPTRQ